MSTETSEPAASSTVSRRKTSAESAMPPDVAGGADVSRRAPAPADMQGELEISALDGAAGFLRKNFLVVFGVSLVLLIPCVWHQRIAAGDLASHTYNAWLAPLVEEREAPRLWLARRRDNGF